MLKVFRYSCISKILFLSMLIVFLASCNEKITESDNEPNPEFCALPDLDFGNDTSKMSFYVENRGGGTLTWELSQPHIRSTDGVNVPVNWITVSPMSGSTRSGRKTEVDVFIDRSVLSPGSYTAKLWVTYSNGPPLTPSCTFVFFFITKTK